MNNDSMLAKVQLTDGLGAGAEAGALAKDREKVFARKLKKAGWHTYRDEKSGRVVTNAYVHERGKLTRLSGLFCEVVSPPVEDGFCAKIGPRLSV
jgi:hypothetical protein